MDVSVIGPDGQPVDVRKALGTGDPKAEEEWEQVMKELESEESNLGRRKKKKVDKEKGKESEAEENRVDEEKKQSGQGRRPRFMM